MQRWLTIILLFSRCGSIGQELFVSEYGLFSIAKMMEAGNNLIWGNLNQFDVLLFYSLFGHIDGDINWIWSSHFFFMSLPRVN